MIYIKICQLVNQSDIENLQNWVTQLTIVTVPHLWLLSMPAMQSPHTPDRHLQIVRIRNWHADANMREKQGKE